MIRFSAALVAVAIGVLIGGIATSKLLLVYIAIAVSAVALVALAIGVMLKREELFGERQGLVPAAAGTGPGLPVHVGGQSKAPNGFVAPPPPAAGATAGYGVPFGGVAQAPAAPGAGPTATRQGAARHGRPAEPAPPWEAAATRAPWTQDRMPAAKDRRAASGAGVRAPSAWQGPAPVTAAGNWDTPGADASKAGAPNAGAPRADVPNADDRAAAAPPRSWVAPPTVPTPVPSDAPAAKPDAGSGATTPTWFDRLGKSAGTDTPTAPSAAPPSASAPGSESGWSWSGQDTGTPGGPAVQEGPAAPAAGSGDDDDDWPTRYSWLDDEPDESGENGQTAETATRETAAQATPDEEPADEEPQDSGADKPAEAAGETGATVLAFRSRKEPEPEPTPEEPTPGSDADHEADPADETAEPEADLDAASEPDAEAAAEPEDEPAAVPAPDGAALVAVVRGVPRYHKPDCVLIRFMPEGDLQKLTVPQAKADGCTPCTACQPTG
ncbi:MAG TPA: hypothetical protein VF223_08080 [Trebonia sp.]